MKLSSEQFQAHIRQDHHRSMLSNYLQEIIYGGNDGIVTTFAVVAGYTGANMGSATAQFSLLTVLLFGMANLFADGASMGLGNYLSTRSANEIYATARRKEEHEIQYSTDFERAETIYLLKKHGFSEEDATSLTNIYQKNPTFWADFMMHYELEMPNPNHDNPIWDALATFFAFIIFGAIPLLPYFMTFSISTAFLYSSLATALALVSLGTLRSWVTKEPWIKAVFEVVLIGGSSSLIAYFVGTLFK